MSGVIPFINTGYIYHVPHSGRYALPLPLGEMAERSEDGEGLRSRFQWT